MLTIAQIFAGLIFIFVFMPTFGFMGVLCFRISKDYRIDTNSERRIKGYIEIFLGCAFSLSGFIMMGCALLSLMAGLVGIASWAA